MSVKMRNIFRHCFSVPTDGGSSTSDVTRRRESREIDRELHREKRLHRRQVKILLLGAGESGKSTFLKQIRIIEGDSFSEKAVEEFALTIRQNILMGMKVLVDAREKLDIPLRNRGNHVHAIRVLSGQTDLAVRPGYFCDLVPSIEALWSEEAIQVTFERRREFQLGDSIKYFLDQLPRIGRPTYAPTNLDILHARRATKGIVECTINIQGVPFQFVDVGGQRLQRQKWYQCFESVNCILFLAAVSEYDQVLLEDRQTNRILEACDIFATFVNNTTFAHIPFILFLNKTDLLEAKYRNCHVSDFFLDFTGDPESLSDVQQYMLNLFEARVSRQVQRKTIYHHWTSVIDTQHTQRIFTDVKEEIRKENIKKLGLM